MGPGDVLVIPPNVPHSGKALTDVSVMDAFAPVREDYRDGGPNILASAAGTRS
jgi:quercetin dioxygenase-like cupin family protein